MQSPNPFFPPDTMMQGSPSPQKRPLPVSSSHATDSHVVSPNYLFERSPPHTPSPTDDSTRFVSPTSPPYGSGLKKMVHWSPAVGANAQTDQTLAGRLNASMDSSLAAGSPARERSSLTATVGAPPLRSIVGDVDAIRRRDAAVKDAQQLSDMQDLHNSSTAASGSSSDVWITVFGFPRSSSDYILSLFARYGTITAHKLADHGNWMHIRYQSVMHARQALAKNARIFDGHLQLGVIPCTETEACASGVPHVFEQEMHSLTTTSLADSSSVQYIPSLSMNASTLNASINSSMLDMSTSSRAGMRSLSAAYAAADNAYRVDRMPDRKDQSLINRLWGYVAGQ